MAGTASPGESNYRLLASFVINEVLTHTDPPLEDAIELFNPTDGPVAIGGWYLSNSQSDFKKFRIPDGTTVQPGGYFVFYENQFNLIPNVPPSFTLNSAHGDAVYLSEADAAGNLTGYRAFVKFGAAENGVSFGRYVTSTGVDFVAMNQRTFGADNPATLGEFRIGTGRTNSAPRVGPVVINELMYHPATVAGTNATENPNEEFIELHNLATSGTPLFDPAHSTNTWRLRGGVDFNFPLNVILPASGFLLVVNFDPATNATAVAAFRSKYRVPAGVPMFGPYGGKLDNGGESIELYKPDPPQLPPHPDAGFVPYVLVDRVAYTDQLPWPVEAGGRGASLQRRISADYGNDPINWKADPPTAGQSNSTDRIISLAILTGMDPDGRFHLLVTGQAGINLVLQASTNLLNWISLMTNNAPNGVLDFTDPNAPNFKARFYRALIPSP